VAGVLACIPGFSSYSPTAWQPRTAATTGQQPRKFSGTASTEEEKKQKKKTGPERFRGPLLKLALNTEFN
jgi:hypothetical protein